MFLYVFFYGYGDHRDLHTDTRLPYTTLFRSLGDHGALDHPGSDQFVTGQAGDEEPAPDLIPGLGAPLAERGCPVEAFADGCPATQARQAGLDRSLVPRVRLRPVLSQYVGDRKSTRLNSSN